ncbi:MAG: hypothetical protein R2731_08615 [Nocardioides sp.]
MADGAKATRQGRTTYGGQAVRNPGLVSKTLIGLNVAVWLLIAATGFGRSRVTDYLALHRDGLCFLPDMVHYQPGVGRPPVAGWAICGTPALPAGRPGRRSPRCSRTWRSGTSR